MSQTTSSQIRISLELLAMVAVIAISSWHIGNYMMTFDGWLMASIMGATLGFCNFLCAHNIFKPNSTSRVPSFVGLIFFAVTSTWMQYTYFNQDPDIGQTLLNGINLDALALGIWAPAAEILLGWIYAAGEKQHAPTLSTAPSLWSKLDRLTEAATHRLEQKLNVDDSPALAVQENVAAINDNKIANDTTGHQHVYSVPIFKAPSKQMDSKPVPQVPVAQHEDDNVEKLSKAEAIERLLNLFTANPHATYEQIGESIGRSKATVSNYVQELKELSKIQGTEHDGIRVL